MSLAPVDRGTEGTGQPKFERRLVAVMFTAMVGYTALIQADERVAIGSFARAGKGQRAVLRIRA